MMHRLAPKNFKELSRKIRHNILLYSYLSKGHHVGSNLSIADILSVLYGSILDIDPKKPNDTKRDRFILSKGHAVLALYCVLAYFKFFSKSKLRTYLKNDSLLLGHPKHSLSGVEFSSGSLGHGLSVGVGLALAAKLDNHNYRVFVLVSDGELNEGSNWEAIQFAAHYKLDNLVVIVDDNGFQALGKTKDIVDLSPLDTKLKSFKWSVLTVDGHNHKKLFQSLKQIPFKKERPTMIIAKTKMGKGISFMQNKLEWHYYNLTKDLLNKAIKENQNC